MKTKEFISATRKLGLNISENHVEIVITDVRDYEICNVSKLNCFSMNTRGAVFINLESDVKEKLLTYLYEYARTPLEEREEVRRYVYELPVVDWSNERLSLYKTSHEYKKLRVTLREDLMDKELLYFTDKEVEQYIGKERALFNACEKIEVTSND